MFTLCMLCALESACDIHDSSNRTPFLHNLLICVRDMVYEGHVSAHIDEFVAVARAALKLCPPASHSDRIMSLTTLTTCL